MRQRWRACLGFVLSSAIAATAHAHPAHVVNAQAVIATDGAYRITLSFDLLAYLLNETPTSVSDSPMNDLLDGPPAVLDRELRDGQARLRDATLVLCDGTREVRSETVTFPTMESMERWKRSNIKPRLPVIGEATFAGHLPEGTRTLSFRFPEVIGDVVLSVERPHEEPYGDLVSAGASSAPLALRLAPTTAAVLPVTEPSPPSRTAIVLRFIGWGFLHILPRGLDHILFVLGLYLLNARLKPLLWQVTAFTVAHSITLALAMLGAVHLPSTLVEPLIAASIVFIAVENLFTSDLKPWRPFVVFGFGLIHGLGFASVIADAGLPRHELVTGLVSFNVGVELGQLCIIAAAVLLFGPFRERPWYRHRIAIPASVLIAIVALIWTIERARVSLA